MEWISIKDRLPTEQGTYIIHVPTLNKNMPVITMAWYNVVDGIWEMIPKVFADTVTDWMPKPKPPTKG